MKIHNSVYGYEIKDTCKKRPHVSFTKLEFNYYIQLKAIKMDIQI